MREARRRGHGHVEHDRQLEGAERGDHLALVGERDRRVPADAHQRLDLPLARSEHLVREDVDRHLDAEPPEAAEARPRPPPPQIARRLHLGAPRAWRFQDAGVADGIARAVEATAETVQHDDQVLGHVRARGHVDPGAGHRRAARARREEPRGGHHVGRGDARPRFDVPRRVVGDRGAESVHAVHVRGDEGAVVEPLVEDHTHHAREQGRILARAHLEVQVGRARELRPAWVDHDDLHAAATSVAQVLEGVRVGGPALAREGGHARVVADEEHDVGVVETLHAGVPPAVPCPGRLLRRLVDRVRREVPLGADRLCPSDDERLGRAEEPMRARVDGDRVRAVAGDERREPLGDLVHRRLASDVCETPVGHPLPHATDA